MRKDFETKLTKAKEQKFRNSIIKASKILGLPCPPKVKIWDGGCPYSDGNEIAHSHPDIGLICISRSRLEAMSMEEIEETAVHETTHMLHIGHDSNFQEAMTDAQLTSWILSHIRNHSKIKLKGINNDKNVCNYHLCRKKDKLKRCSYCGNYYCKKHIKPRMAITLRQVSSAKEPLKSWLEKEYRREDGHPDFAYTRIAWQRLEDKEKRKNEKMWETLDGLKGGVKKDLKIRKEIEAEELAKKEVFNHYGKKFKGYELLRTKFVKDQKIWIVEGIIKVKKLLSTEKKEFQIKINAVNGDIIEKRI